MSEEINNKTQEELLNLLSQVMENDNKRETLKAILQAINENKFGNALTILNDVQIKARTASEEIDNILASANSSQNEINSICNTIKQKDNQSSNSLSQIQEAQSFAEKLKADYDRFYNPNNPQSAIITKLDEACSKIEENKGKIEELDNFYKEIFNGIKDEDGVEKPGLKEFLEVKKNELEQMQEEEKNKFEKLYKEKDKELNALYDPSTSAGLSKAYADEKGKIEKELNRWNKIFIGSIIVFILVFIIYFYWSLTDTFNYINFLRALPFWVFSGFFIFYSTKQIAEYKRMASEYAHKETLNKTYIGYKKQIEEVENKDLKEKLLNIMLESAQANPSRLLGNKGDIPSATLIEKTKDLIGKK